MPYFGAAIEIVDRNHGVINQFLGDGFMARFGALVATGRDCRNALTSARELLVAMKALSDSGRMPATSIGVGLHAGEAVSGNIGSQTRQQYSISGNEVILASRIEQLNKDYDSRLLVSVEVLREAGEGDHDAKSLGLVQVKAVTSRSRFIALLDRAGRDGDELRASNFPMNPTPARVAEPPRVIGAVSGTGRDVGSVRS
jgi:class 3 adenylate cyclase